MTDEQPAFPVAPARGPVPRLTGKVAIVTGADRGLGRAIAGATAGPSYVVVDDEPDGWASVEFSDR